ncbi:hypothetical protein GCM10009827_074280 [Dactylosporangium maewongense]|uniref:Knr4/Smi1-like domain-containing protein n=1 Tax=Dactylosporangium maewongense TaxID=634393 RepID=A0ABN2BMH8_9ACTN
MPDTDRARLARISAKLTAARALPSLPPAFGVESHKFVLEPPVPEAAVTAFEERHEVTLPPAYRLFITELGGGGAGPGCELLSFAGACSDARCRPGHLAQPSPYLPGPRYPDDWEQRYEDPPAMDRIFLRGTLPIAFHGCTLYTRLVVTGPARGRLFNLDTDGLGPYVVEDADFLAWYERWLDEVMAGYDVGWFGERLPLDEPALIAALAGDPSPQRRTRAGESLLLSPVISEQARTAVADAMSTDGDPTVRAHLYQLLRWQHRDPRRTPAKAVADAIARHARSQTPPDIEALTALGMLTLADVLPALAGEDLERRRRAAYILARKLPRNDRERDVIEGAVRDLLDDPDPLVRTHAATAVREHALGGLNSLLRDRRRTEADPWTQDSLAWTLNGPYRDWWIDPAFTGADDPPF